MNREELKAKLGNIIRKGKLTDEVDEVLAEFDRLTEARDYFNKMWDECSLALVAKAEALERICEPLRREYDRGFYIRAAYHGHSANVVDAIREICDYLDSQQRVCPSCGGTGFYEGMKCSCHVPSQQKPELERMMDNRCRMCGGKIEPEKPRRMRFHCTDCGEETFSGVNHTCKPKDEDVLRGLINNRLAGGIMHLSREAMIADILEHFQLKEGE